VEALHQVPDLVAPETVALMMMQEVLGAIVQAVALAGDVHVMNVL
jgi:hypothetical protein